MLSLLYSRTQTYQNTHADIHMHLSMLQTMYAPYVLTSFDAARQSEASLHPTFRLILGACLYPYEFLLILFFPWPLLLISLSKPLSSNSLYLPYCRSVSVLTLLHFLSHLYFLCFFSPPSSSPHLYRALVSLLLYTVCICNCCTNFTI